MDVRRKNPLSRMFPKHLTVKCKKLSFRELLKVMQKIFIPTLKFQCRLGEPATSLLPVYPIPGPATVATRCPALPDGMLPEAQVSVLNGEGLCYPSSLHMVYTTNLYVGFLSRTIDDSCLRELFAPFGTVTQARVILDMETGCSKGYGFVSFDTPYAASLPIMHMNGCQIDGHRLTVRMRTGSTAPPTGPPLAKSLLPVYSISQPTSVATRCPALPPPCMKVNVCRINEVIVTSLLL